jgi:RimJ/RimL family protein N-acetyltransferase
MYKDRPAVLHTPRLRLQTLNDIDAERMMDLLTNEQISKTFMVPNFTEREQSRRVFEALKTLSQNPARFVYGIWLGDTLIGLLNDVEQTQEYVEIGFVIDPNYQNHWYATEAFSCALQALFALGFQCVKTGAFAENTASIRVMEKCEMTRLEEVTNIEYRGENHACVWFEKTP